MPRPCLICGNSWHHTRDHHAVMTADIVDLDATIGTMLLAYAGMFIAGLILAAIGC